MSTLDPRVRLTEYLWDHPEHGMRLREMVAKDFPQAAGTMPEVIVAKQTNDALGKVREDNDKLRQTLDADRAQRAYERATDDLVSRGLVARTDLPALVEHMKKHRIADWEAGARDFRTVTQVAAPSPDHSYRGIEVPGVADDHDDFFKKLNVADPSERDRVTRAEAHRVWNDITNGRTDKWAAYIGA